MRRASLGLATLLLTSRAVALDLCPLYATVHKAQALARIKSGIPFNLLSIAVANDGRVYRHVVHIGYDLWDETVTVELLGKPAEVVKLADAGVRICSAVSFPEAATAQRYQVRLFLNPVLGQGMARLRDGNIGSGLLQVHWEQLVRELETEKVLLDLEVRP